MLTDFALVPQTQATLKVPLSALPSLTFSVYSEQVGQAQASLKVEGDDLYVTANCDSLERVVRMYEDVLMSRSMVAIQQTKVTNKLTIWQRSWIFLGKILTLAALTGALYLAARRWLGSYISKSWQMLVKWWSKLKFK